MSSTKYYKAPLGNVVARAYIDFEGKYRIDIKRMVRQYAGSRDSSYTKAGILETNRTFADKTEANEFFRTIQQKDNLGPAEEKDWVHFRAD